MAQRIVQINGRLVVPVEEFEQHTRPEDAQFFTTIPGLLWKIWIIDRTRGEAGGIYLFADEDTCQSYLDGPVVAQLAEWPLWTDLSVKRFDYLPEASAVTHAPVGERGIPSNGAPKTFTSMADAAYRAVPAIKAADLYRRRKNEADLLVIDVRDAAEIAQTGMIPDSINLSYGSLTYLADNEVPEEWRDPRLANHARPIVTTCVLGPLGALGGKLLHDMGFSNVQILEGGVQAWIDAGLPVVRTRLSDERHVGL